MSYKLSSNLSVDFVVSHRLAKVYNFCILPAYKSLLSSTAVSTCVLSSCTLSHMSINKLLLRSRMFSAVILCGRPNVPCPVGTVYRLMSSVKGKV